jgi:preprotein translocase subunit SecE
LWVRDPPGLPSLTWSRNRKYMAKGSTSKLLDNIKWFAALAVFSAAVIGNSYFVEVAFLYRVLGVVFLFIVGLGILAVTNFGSNAIKLMRESRTEIRRVVWPTRIETTQTFLVVFGSIIVLCLFFWALESLLTFLTKLVLG